MLQVNVKIFDSIDHQEGISKQTGKPYSFDKQQAQIEGGDKAPSLPFGIFLNEGQQPYQPGIYKAILAPKPGSFRNSVDWDFVEFIKA